jgi:hypothetical protein
MRWIYLSQAEMFKNGVVWNVRNLESNLCYKVYVGVDTQLNADSLNEGPLVLCPDVLQNVLLL